MSGLRKAIEQLCEAQGEDSYVMVYALRKAIAAYPDEQVPAADREALIQAMARADRRPVQPESASWHFLAGATYGRHADAVLALLNGSAP